MKSELGRFVVAAVFVFIASGFALAAATPAEQCAATKFTETGKNASGKLKCWSKEVFNSHPTRFSECNAKVEGLLAYKFAKAEAEGGCATTGDTGTIEAKVDAFTDDVVTELTGSPAGALLGTDAAKKCAGAKLRAAGKKTAFKTKCYSQAATTGTLDPLCISRAEDVFHRKWAAAESKGGCATTNDEGAIEAKVDAFVGDVVHEIQDIPCEFSFCTLRETCQFVVEVSGSDACSCRSVCVPNDSVCAGCSIGNCYGGLCSSFVSSCGGACDEQQSNDCIYL